MSTIAIFNSSKHISYEIRRLIEEFTNKKVKAINIHIGRAIVYFDPTADKDKIQIKAPTLDNQWHNLQEFDAFMLRQAFSVMKLSINVIKWIKEQLKRPVFDNNILQSQYLVNKMTEGFEILLNHLHYPKTLYFTDYETFKNRLEELEEYLNGYPIIIKHISKGKGYGVFKMNSRDELLQFINELITSHHKGEKAIRSYLFQEFLEIESEYRVLVLNNKVLGAMQRIPPEGDFRANYSVGGTVKAATVTPQMREIALKAVRASNVVFSGVDYAITKDGRHLLLEVNRTPGFEGFEQATKINVAREFVEYFIDQYLNKA